MESFLPILFFFLLFSIFGYFCGKIFKERTPKIIGIIAGILFIVFSGIGLIGNALNHFYKSIELIDLIKSLALGITIGIFFLIGAISGLYVSKRKW